MKKKISKPFLIAFVSLLLGVGYYTYTRACADVEWEDWYTSMFAPEMASEKGKEPFFLSMLQFYKTPTVYDNVSTFDDVNIDEWEAFFKKQVAPDHLRYLLYRASTGEIDTAIFHLRDAAFPLTANLTGNTIFEYPNAVDAKDFLFYVGYARRCEPFATYNPNGWSAGDEPWRSDAAEMEKHVQGGNKMLASVKNPFIRERYFFQVLRLKFLQSDFAGVIDYYTKNLQYLATGNTMRYRCMGYLAGAHRRLGQVAKASHLYALIFDKCRPMRITAYQSFKPVDETDWQQTLAMAQNKRQKCATWQLLGLQNDPLRAMKEIYAIDPLSDLSEILLVRLVNISEAQFLPPLPYGYYYNPQNRPNDFALVPKDIDPELVRFVNQVAKSGNATNPLLWKLSAGYLALAQGKYEQANAALNQVKNHASATPLMKSQARLLLMVSQIDQNDVQTPDFENAIAAELNWLNAQRTDTVARTSYAFNWCLRRLGQKYMANGQTLKAQLLDPLTDPMYYMADDNCTKMKAFIDAPEKNSFEKFLLSQYPHKKSDIVTLEALKLFYTDRLDDAIYQLAEDTASGNLPLLGDPFHIRINDCHDCDHMEVKNVVYTQRSFIKQMQQYQQKAVNKPKDAAKNYFLMANGYYNATYFGNARTFYETPLVNFGSYQYWDRDFSGINNTVLNCQTAMNYYQKAMDLSKDKEFKAKCCFMAAKCELNLLYISGKLDRDEDFRAGKYFHTLQSYYKKTKYYNEVVSECKYFNTFASHF